jgi:hypothetical protein
MGEHKKKLKIDFDDTNSSERHLLAVRKKFGEPIIMKTRWITKNDEITKYRREITKNKKGQPYSKKKTTKGAFGEEYKKTPWIIKFRETLKGVING